MEQPRPSLWLVRHGATQWSIDGRHTGRTDVPLTEAGRADGARAGEVLAGEEFSLVLASPLRRARDTAALAGFPDAELTDELREWDYGEYEGLTTEQIRRTHPTWTVFADGCPGGETAADVGRRADAVIRRVRQQPGRALAFAHGHILRVLAARWLDLPPGDGRLLALDTATVSVLDWERESPVVRRWNAG